MTPIKTLGSGAENLCAWTLTYAQPIKPRSISNFTRWPTYEQAAKNGPVGEALPTNEGDGE